MIKFAIVGCGRIAQRHAEHIAKRGQLVAVCDVVEDKAQQLATMYAANAYTSYADMLANEPSIEVIAICSPNGLHAQHAIDGLKAGFHVLCEKPMGLSVKECGEMIQAAERANKRSPSNKTVTIHR
jgi:predicted dehydrogenase